MKKLLLISFFAIYASISYAGSGCGEGTCTKDGKDKADGKTGFADVSVIVAGSSCGEGSCGKDKKDVNIKKTGLIESSALFAGAGCGSGCEKKDKAPKDTTTKDSLFSQETVSA
jgi:hypothetical protein